MELELTANTVVRDVKKQFQSAFPFLKIEFFKYAHQRGQGSPLKDKVKGSERLIDVTGVLKEGKFSLDPSFTVAAFEEKMQQDHGLPVQVFRKSGDLWLETVQTDGLTLEAQNQMGEASTSDTRIRFNSFTLFL